MERWNGRIALVTGASTGLGAEFCRILVKHGMKVVGCARNEERIQKIADELKGEKGKLYAVKCDLGNEEDVSNLFEYIKKNFGKVDVCINNAGFANATNILEGKVSDWKGMMNVNVIGLLQCCKESINLMKANNIDDGHVINISSMGGRRLIGTTAYGVYCASKTCVNVLTEVIRRELRDNKSHIKISIISPGMTETEFAYRALPDMPTEKVTDIYKSIKSLQKEDIGAALIYLLSSPPHVQVHDILIRPTEQTS